MYGEAMRDAGRAVGVAAAAVTRMRATMEGEEIVSPTAAQHFDRFIRPLSSKKGITRMVARSRTRHGRRRRTQPADQVIVSHLMICRSWVS